MTPLIKSIISCCVSLHVVCGAPLEKSCLKICEFCVKQKESVGFERHDHLIFWGETLL